MKSRITNIHNELISLFVKVDGVEKQVQILPGESMIIDAYETRTMRFFGKKEFIKLETNESENHEDLIPNKFISLEDDLKFKELKHELTLDTNNQIKEEILPTPKIFSTALEIIEGEVEQYIEGGFIKGEWSDEDLIFLKKNYPTKGRKYCATHLNRNESSVQKKINTLKLKKRKKK